MLLWRYSKSFGGGGEGTNLKSRCSFFCFSAGFGRVFERALEGAGRFLGQGESRRVKKHRKRRWIWGLGVGGALGMMHSLVLPA